MTNHSWLTVITVAVLFVWTAQAGELTLHLARPGKQTAAATERAVPERDDRYPSLALSLGTETGGVIPVSLGIDGVVDTQAAPGGQGRYRLAKPASGVIVSDTEGRYLQLEAEVSVQARTGAAQIVYDVTLTAEVPPDGVALDGPVELFFEARRRAYDADGNVLELKPMTGVLRGLLEAGP